MVADDLRIASDNNDNNNNNTNRTPDDGHIRITWIHRRAEIRRRGRSRSVWLGTTIRWHSIRTNRPPCSLTTLPHHRPSPTLPTQVAVKTWKCVAKWQWNAGENEDCCGICRNAFEQAAPDCRFPGDDSPVVFGVCSHAFHLQCINKWLSSQSESRCPLCRSAWEFKAAAENDTGGDDGNGDA